MRLILYTPLGTHLVDTGGKHAPTASEIGGQASEGGSPIHELSARRIGGLVVATVSLGVPRKARSRGDPADPAGDHAGDYAGATGVNGADGVAGGVGLALSMAGMVKAVVVAHRELIGVALCGQSVAGGTSYCPHTDTPPCPYSLVNSASTTPCYDFDPHAIPTPFNESTPRTCVRIFV